MSVIARRADPPPPPSLAAIILGASVLCAALPLGTTFLGFASVIIGRDLRTVPTWTALGIVLGVLLSLVYLWAGLRERLGEPKQTTPAPMQQTLLIQPPPLLSPDIRIVPLRTEDRRLIDDVEEQDLRWFIDELHRGRPHTQPNWIGKILPSGKVIDPLIWRSLCMPLRKVQIIRDVKKGYSGRLMTRDATEILAALGLDDPYNT